MESRDPVTDRTATYWLTRDVDDEGVLSELVDVWIESPAMYKLEGKGSFWLGAGDIGLEARYSQWTVDECVKNCRTYPATGRECIRVGHEVHEVKDS